MKKLTHGLLLFALLAGCAVPPPPAPPAPAAAAAIDASAAWYRKAAAAGQKVYPIDSAQSLITVTVRRGGALARFGHDHVIASRAVSGMVAPDAGRADFQFRLDQMTVDEAALRSEAGLGSQPSEDDLAGTRRNMLNRVLEAERFPLVLLHAERVRGAGDTLRLSVTLHGVTRTLDVPTTIVRGKDSISASGTLTLLQSDFGITPMSVMAGALTVQDPMALRFNLVARALPKK